jgi:hypothetical protein
MINERSITGKWASYGYANANLVVAGHSHAASILEGMLESKNDNHSDCNDDFQVCYTADLNDGPPGDSDYWKFVAKISNGKDLAIVWNGNQHNANFLFQTMPPFKISGSSSNQLTDEEYPITKSMIRAFFEPSFDELREIVPMMSGSKRVFLVSGPAPKPLIHIKDRITQEQFFTDIADSLGVMVKDLEITSDSLRVELWSILSEMLKKISAELRVGFVDTPEDSIDPKGLLRERYWTPDVTHANAEYGKLLVRKIYRAIDASL